MVLTDLVRTDLIKVPLKGTDRISVITEMVDMVADVNSYPNNRRDEILDAVLNRESLGSTGIGSGVCVPHAKCDAVDEMIAAVGIAPHPIDCDAPDGELVSLFFLVLAPSDAANQHVELLASIARTCISGSFLKFAKRATSADDLYHLIKD